MAATSVCWHSKAPTLNRDRDLTVAVERMLIDCLARFALAVLDVYTIRYTVWIYSFMGKRYEPSRSR